MTLQLAQEAERGLEFLKGIVESGKILKLGEPRRTLYGSGSSVLVGISAMGRSYNLFLTREHLDDLPGTKANQDSAERLARSLDSRIRNVDPNLFMTRSGRLLHIRIEGPMQPWYNEQNQMTGASFVWVIATDHITNEVTHCKFRMTHSQLIPGFGPNPFNRCELMTNSVRAAVDSGSVVFYRSAEEHPESTNENVITLSEMKPVEKDQASNSSS